MQRPRCAGQCSAPQCSPLWDVHRRAWTGAAIDAGKRVGPTSHETVEQAFRRGEHLTAAPDGRVNHDPNPWTPCGRWSGRLPDVRRPLAPSR